MKIVIHYVVMVQGVVIVRYVFLQKKKKRERERKKNKAGYTVADRWAGAETLVFPLFNSCSPTERRTDGCTKPLIESLVRD